MASGVESNLPNPLAIGLARSLGEQIANHLRDEILSGRLPAGEALREVELSQRFGTSRGPVRDALHELTKEGILVAQRRGGVRVAAPAPDSIRQLVMPIRKTIETYALRLFFADITPRDLALWDEILERMRQACERRDFPSIAETDIALHRSFLERAAQPDLLAIWSTIVGRVRQHFIESCAKYADLNDNYAEHRMILDAIRTGDVEAAVKALEQHIC